jgi:iron complex outermembrane receptor protein
MKHLLLILFLAIPFIFYAQSLTGTLTDKETGNPIIAADIICSNGQKTFSGEQGEFSLEVSSFPVTITFKHEDFSEDSLIVKDNSPIHFSLKQSKAQNLEDIVVSASRRKQKIEDVAISMDILKPELINNKGYAKIDDALGQSPGVYSMDGQISIRGGSGFSYGAGSRVMLLWNGIPMLSADAGDAKWNTVPIELLSNVEIIKGASSVLYGSGALNGIISISEINPTEKPYYRAKVQFGIYDKARRKSLRNTAGNTFQLAEFAHGQKVGNFFYNIGLNLYNNQGFRAGETEKRARITGSVGYNFQKVRGLQTGVGFSVHYQRLGSFLIWESDSLAYMPKGGADYKNPASTATMISGLRVMVDPYLKYIGTNGTKHFLKTRIYSVNNQSLSNASQSSLGNTYYADYLFQKEFGKLVVLSAGATYTRTQVIAKLYGNHHSDNLAAYLQSDFKVGKFTFTAGVRLEYFKQDNTPIDSYLYLKKDSSVKMPVYPIARVAMTYKPIEGTILRASFGQGVRYPATSERFVSTSVGPLNIFPNPNLKREEGVAAEIGFKQIFKVGNWKGMLDLAGFLNEYRNMTEFTFGVYNPKDMILSLDPNSPNYLLKWIGFRAENAEKARILGAEITFASEGKIGDVTIRSLLGYNYINPISLNKSKGYRANFSDTTTNMLKYRFNHLAKADVEVEYKGINFGVSMRYNSYMKNIDRIFEEGVVGVQILQGLKQYRQTHNKGVAVFDARIGYTIKDHYQIGVMVNNLFNVEYTGRPGDIREPRTYMVQLQVKF